MERNLKVGRKNILKYGPSWNQNDNWFRKKKPHTLVHEFQRVLYPRLSLTYLLARVKHIMFFFFHSSCIIFTAMLTFGLLFFQLFIFF